LDVVTSTPVRGEIWLTNLDPTIGREIQKTRPCLIISPDSMNAHLRTVTAMPLTSGSHPAPFRIPVRFEGKVGLLLADQIRTLDRRRMVKRLGKVSGATLTTALAVMREMFEP
jgi:mRNA interferase MazF